jgi:hypothetical protein
METPTIDADELQERFLASLRERVSWQAEQAERLRAEAAPISARVDVLDMAALNGLVDRNADRPRAREWRSFLAELEGLTDTDGRLPDQLERLIRVVLADLLP